MPERFESQIANSERIFSFAEIFVIKVRFSLSLAHQKILQKRILFLQYFFIHCESNGISSRFSVYIIAIGVYISNDDIPLSERLIYKATPLFQLAFVILYTQRGNITPKNYLLVYSKHLRPIRIYVSKYKSISKSLFQIRKSSSSVYANIREASYGQNNADMLSKFEIALKECSGTEGWLQLLFNTNSINEETYKKYRNLCGRIRRVLISSCKTLKKKHKMKPLCKKYTSIKQLKLLY